MVGGMQLNGKSVQPENPLAERYQELDRADLEGLEGWETFNISEKKFLSVLGAFASKTAAAKFVGLSPSWIQKRQQANPLFRSAAEWRRDTATRIITSWIPDFASIASAQFLDILINETDPKLKLDAIKFAFHIAGVGKDRFAPQTVIQTANFQMWEGSRAEQRRLGNGKVVDTASA